jgi:hypothetical protein
MSDSHYSFRQFRFVTRTVLVGLFTAALGIGCWTPASAEQPKPKLSKDLRARLGGTATGPIRVIVQGNADAIAQKHNASVKKRLRSSAVLEVTPEQLAAMSDDSSISHLSGDARVQRMMALTARATGADQVWSGVAGLPGYTASGSR